jgi:hypothetical protein
MELNFLDNNYDLLQFNKKNRIKEGWLCAYWCLKVKANSLKPDWLS